MQLLKSNENRIHNLNIENLLSELKESAENIPSELKKLAQDREDARAQKDWKRADEVRELIRSRGYIVDDTDNGPVVRKVS